MKKFNSFLLLSLLLIFGFSACKQEINTKKRNSLVQKRDLNPSKKSKKKTAEERAAFSEARAEDEAHMQINPLTGTVSRREKMLEKKEADAAPRRAANSRTPGISGFIPRGPNNLGGRTRAVVYDISDLSGNTLLAGGVSGGVFRTTNGGGTWVKVSSQSEIHNVTALAQDPTNNNIWYYGTGESSGNSSSLNGSTYYGQGIWQSTDGGLNWTQLGGTNSAEDTYDSAFDLVNRLAVHPTSGDLYAACSGGQIMRFNGSVWNTELADPTLDEFQMSDIVIASTGRVYAAFAGNASGSINGIWTSATGVGGWSRIAQNGNPGAWSSAGRTVLAISASNPNILYALYVNGQANTCPANLVEADIWQYNLSGSSWTNYTSKMPDEGGCSEGNDPFDAQGGYDLTISVKPDNQNFVVIGGTNAYKIPNITTSSMFQRMGGYNSSAGYSKYSQGGGDTHHPDIHVLAFNPFNPTQLISGTDGGVHRTTNINASPVSWTNINNDYQTHQYYFIAADSQLGSDAILGGAQDNGTTAGGTTLTLPDNLQHSEVLGGDGCAVAISRDDACLPFFMSTQNGAITRDCPSYNNITPTGSLSRFVTYFHLDPDNPNNLYYAGRQEIYRTSNSSFVNSGSWTNLGSLNDLGGIADYVRTFQTTRGAYNPATSYLMVGTDEGQIYRLDDPANSTNVSQLVNITPAGATLAYPSIVSGIAIHPTNPDIAMAVYSNYGINSIFLTMDATAALPTWTVVEQNLPNASVRSCAIAEVSGQVIYLVGTARGLFSSLDPTTLPWTKEGEAVMGSALVSHLVYRPGDNRLFIGTHGNGIYEALITDVLSIDLSVFEAKLEDNNQVQLRWTTATETNNMGFEIQRSFDGKEFKSIGFVDGAGTTDSPMHYFFIDRELRESMQYYRINQIDDDGKASLSDVRAVSIPLAGNETFNFHVFPNPVSDVLNIRLGKTPENELRVQIVNMKGAVIANQAWPKGLPDFQLKVADFELANGMYLLQVLDTKKLLHVEKVNIIR